MRVLWVSKKREKMMTYYAALDVGLRTTAVCIVDGNGEIQLEKSLASEVDDRVTCRRGFGAEITAVGLEAGTLTQWLIPTVDIIDPYDGRKSSTG